MDRERSIFEFVIPKQYRLQAIRGCHDDIGHLGTSWSIKDRFFWPNMIKDVEKHIKNCIRCINSKSYKEIAPLQPVLATHPIQLVHIEYHTVELPKKYKGSFERDINVILVKDHFARYAQSFVTSSQSVNIGAKTLWDKYFMYYGFPEKIMSDQGRNFESKFIQELLYISHTKKVITTPYDSQIMVNVKGSTLP